MTVFFAFFDDFLQKIDKNIGTMRRNRLLRSLFLLCAIVVGSTSAWATTYQLTKVTTVKDGGLYVFEQKGYVMNNTCASSALQCVSSYNATELSGTESYVWTLEAATGGFYMRNVSLKSYQYLNNTSSTSVSFGSKNSIWTFSFTDGVALISNKSNSNRFLGFYEDGVYKAYATSNLSSYDHAITVYELVEEGAATKPTHNVTFSVNGIAGEPASVAEDAAITFPANPAGVGGKAFVGWTTTPISGTTDEAPSLVSEATMGTADIMFYAVFAKETSGEVTKTDELTKSTTGVTSTTYSAWSSKQAIDGSDAVYAGNSAGGSSAIQLRSTNSSGIISTTSGGKVKKVTVIWNSATSDDRTLEVYGKNEAYTSTSVLYGVNQGTLLGSIEYKTSNGTSTELEITDEYEYIGLRSKSGAMFLTKITIDWEAGGVTYSEYCTSVTVPVSIGAAGYATFSSAYATDFSAYDALKVYYINSTSGNIAKTTEIESKKVPANTGVIMKGNAGIYNAACIATAPEVIGNLLFACVDGYTADYDNEIYILSSGTNGIGFYPIAANTTLDAGKAFIGGGDVSAKYLILSFEDGVTDIANVDVNDKFDDNSSMYNLAGQKVGKKYKGIVIVKGKKYMQK